MKKRGLSILVTSLILIVLVLVAVGILYVVYINFIKTGAGELSAEKFMIVRVGLKIQNAYIDEGKVIVVVRRAISEVNVTGIKFIFSDGLEDFSVERKFVLQQLEQKAFTFTSTEVGGISEVKEVSIAPIYEFSGSEKMGDITDTKKISNFPPPGVEGLGGDGDNANNDDNSVFPNCGDGICNVEENTLTCPQDCSVPDSCDGEWNLTESESVECDDASINCVSCICIIGYKSDGEGGCILEASLNTGTIGSVWPPGAPKYFDSEDLPKISEINKYMGKYVNFSGTGADSRCLLISYAEYLSNPAYNKSYIRLEAVANISTGQIYEIWSSPTCGD